jgi:hypothetical protein
MERAILLLGQESVDNRVVESYQLLIGCNYLSRTYDGSEDRYLFLDEASDAFARRILDEGTFLEVSVFNGLRIEDSNSHRRLPPLEKVKEKQFSEKVCDRIREYQRHAMN